MVAVSVVGFPEFAPCPRAGVTITGLGVGASLVSVWRTADGERSSVRGARRIAMNDAAYVVDYDVPTGRPVSYEVEVISGPSGASRVTADPVTVGAIEGCIMDPLVPQSAVAIMKPQGWAGKPVFAAQAMSSLEYAADVQVFKIMGSDKPLALFGQRQAAAGVDLSMVTDTAEENARLRNLFNSTGNLLVRLPLSWTKALPGVCFMAVATVSEGPTDAGSGGALTTWSLSGDTVAAPTIKPLTGGVTFGDVAMLYTTFQAKHDSVVAAASAAGEQPTFLFDMMHPLG